MDPHCRPEAAFASMDRSSASQWLDIHKATQAYQPHTPQQILALLETLRGVYVGFGVDQLDHSLQAATRAHRAGASDELVLAALCHDLGKTISIANHAAIAAEILKPYVSDATYQIVRTHQDFQGRHYYHHFGGSRDLREAYRDEPWYADAERFTDDWDQAAFDPDYESLPLSEFAPLVKRFFGRFVMGR
jgi:predicted HD phosphohydrolase